jgi:maleamate amidohydrolase
MVPAIPFWWTKVGAAARGKPMQDFDAARQLYDRKGFARRVGWGLRPAVLVIDLTNGFTDPASPVGADLSEVIGETNRLLTAARAYEVPVIFTSIAYHDPDLEGGYWVSKIPALRVLRHGTPAVEVDARIGRRTGEPVIYKCFTSPFFGTHLQSILQRLRVDTLLLCGTSTSGCVRAAAADAVQLGFRCVVPQSAVGDRAEAPHRANLFDIDAKYGDVTTLDGVLAELDRWARAKRPG